MSRHSLKSHLLAIMALSATNALFCMLDAEGLAALNAMLIGWLAHLIDSAMPPYGLVHSSNLRRVS